MLAANVSKHLNYKDNSNPSPTFNQLLKQLNHTEMNSILPTHSTSVTLYIIAILFIYVIIFVALIISNFLTDHDQVEENQEEIKKYYSSGLRGKKSNRLRNLFISYNSTSSFETDYVNEPSKYLTTWKNKFLKSPGYNKQKNLFI